MDRRDRITVTAPHNHDRHLRAKRAAALATATVVTLATLTGCSKVVDGQLSTQIEGLSTDISCSEFTTLSDSERLQVVTQILEETSPSEKSTQRPFVMVTLAGVLCQGMPDMQLKALLGRMRVR
jgi:hypothetical protein